MKFISITYMDKQAKIKTAIIDEKDINYFTRVYKVFKVKEI